MGPQKVCSNTEDLYQLQGVENVHRQEVERSCCVEHLSSDAAHFALPRQMCVSRRQAGRFVGRGPLTDLLTENLVVAQRVKNLPFLQYLA